MSISATLIALFIFIAVIVGYVIHIKKRNPREKLPLSDDVQKMYQGYYIIVLKICRKAILSTKKTLLLQMYKEY